MKKFAIITIISLISIACSGVDPNLPNQITPIPNSVETFEGSFQMPHDFRFTTNLEQAEIADLEKWIKTTPFKSIPIIYSNEAPNLHLIIAGHESPESYKLEIKADKIEITAPASSGLFYGLQSLLQMITFNQTDALPLCKIEDSPRFEYRGMMLDVSRHFYDVDYVKGQLDLMARYKLNNFHWHLTDGAGWRIEIKKYPLLTDIAAWRPYPNWEGWNEEGRKYCDKNDPEAQGGYYTQEQVREIIEYARLRHINVIPEIEMPGHCEEVLAVYPELSCSGKPYTQSDFCVGNDATFEFLEGVLSEVIDLFPSKFIHIGGDEASKGWWKECPKCQARIKKEGLKDVDELQSYMIHRIEEFLNSKGRDLLGWDEIIEGGLAPNATVMSWRGTEGGLMAARQGNRAIMTPTEHCYFDYCQDDPEREPIAAAAFLQLPTVYSYNPVPEDLTPEVAKNIIGIQGNLWTEHVPTSDHATHMLWPRMIAIAEVGWSNLDRKNYEDFHRRTLRSVEWMQRRGYTPFDLKNGVGDRPKSLEPVSNLATGKSVKYATMFHPKYSAKGEGSLTNGKLGNWQYAADEWLGWLNCDMDVTVDLGKATPIKRIASEFRQGYSAYIWMPKEVEFYTSLDGENFTKVGVAINNRPYDYKRTCFDMFEWNGEAEARYVRINAINNDEPGGWLFTDEIIIE